MRNGERANGSLTYRHESGAPEREQEQQGEATELRGGLRFPLDAEDFVSVKIHPADALRDRGTERAGRERNQLFHMGKF